MVSLFRTSEIKTKYEIGEVIGTGNFAEVRRGKNKQTGEAVAIKVIELGERSDLPLVKREIDILGKLSHPNITQMIDVYESTSALKKNKVRPKIFLPRKFNKQTKKIKHTKFQLALFSHLVPIQLPLT
jgi:serine/threonine protein kinase